jgi:hypothetical protein
LIQEQGERREQQQNIEQGVSFKIESKSVIGYALAKLVVFARESDRSFAFFGCEKREYSTPSKRLKAERRNTWKPVSIRQKTSMCRKSLRHS